MRSITGSRRVLSNRRARSLLLGRRAGAAARVRITNGAKGEAAFYSGRLLTLEGDPIAGGILDVWSGDGEGTYDMQMPGQDEMRCRGKFRTDAEGRYWFRSI